jgi:hypothetical protein
MDTCDVAVLKSRLQRQDNLINKLYSVMSQAFCGKRCGCDKCLEDIADIIGHYKQGID